MKLSIYLLCFAVGFLFGEAYITGPQKYFIKGRDAAWKEVKEKYILVEKPKFQNNSPVLKNLNP